MIGALTVCMLVSAQSASAQVQVKNVHFEGLLKLYRSYGLPLPPAGSVPVVYRIGAYAGTGEIIYALAIRTPFEDGEATYYHGASISVSWEKRFERVLGDTSGLPSNVSVGGRLMMSFITGEGPFMEDAGIAIVIQAYALGYTSLSKQLIGRDFMRWGGGAGGLGDLYRLPEDASMEQRVDYLALLHSINRWVSGEGDRGEIAIVIQKALGSNMIEKSERLDKELAGFWESLKPNTATPGSPRWQINELVNAHVTYGIYYWRAEDEPPALLKDLGFADLPLLAEYVDDIRWTRTAFPGQDNAGAHVVSLGALVKQVVERISSGHAGTFRRNSTKEAILAYCDAARTGDLVSYWKTLLEPAHLIEMGIEPPLQFEYDALQKFSELYPKEFIATYLEAIRTRGDRDTWGMTLVIQQMPLETDEIVEILERGATSPWPAHRRAALRQLTRYNPPNMAALLKRNYDSIPGGKLTEDQLDLIWHTCSLAPMSRDEAVWASLHRLYRRSQPAVKAHIAGTLDWPFADSAKTNTDLNLRFLAQYIDEDATFTESEAEEVYGSRLKRNRWMTLGDYIVLTIGMLYVNRDGEWSYERYRPDWYDDWTEFRPEDVAKIRADVTQRLRADGYLKG